MAKKEKLKNLSHQELLTLEREVLGFNITSVIGDNRLKIQKLGFNGINAIHDCLLNSDNVKNLLVAAIVQKIESCVSSKGNYFYWIHLIDDYSSIKLYCSDKTFKELSQGLIVNKCSLFNINIKNDFVTFDKARLVENIQFKDDFIFVIHIEPGMWTNTIIEYIEDNIGVFINSGNVRVYQRSFNTDLMIEPTDSLILNIMNKFNVKCSVERYDDYMWPELKKYENYE